VRSNINDEGTSVGNMREIRQVEPLQGLGVVIRIRPECVDRVRETIPLGSDLYYTSFYPAGAPIEFPNLDGPDVDFGILPGDHIVIQSGGKMWCGYEQFVQLIGQLAPMLEDALFYVGDEVDYIDEFRISDGRLNYQRVHEGYWWSVRDFLRTNNRLSETQ
jgi:hypothetical protein